MGNRVTFLGHTRAASRNPRIGVCNNCRSVLGMVDAQTGKFCRKKGFDIHHELYDFSDPAAHTLEYVLYVMVNTIKNRVFVGEAMKGQLSLDYKEN